MPVTAHGDTIREASALLADYAEEGVRRIESEGGREAVDVDVVRADLVAAVAALEAEVAEANERWNKSELRLAGVMTQLSTVKTHMNGRCEHLTSRALAAEAETERLREALKELSRVPDSGPFPNKGACAAFAAYVQETARRGLASVAVDGQPA